jgi:hypothetical protein
MSMQEGWSIADGGTQMGAYSRLRRGLDLTFTYYRKCYPGARNEVCEKRKTAREVYGAMLVLL